MASEYYYFKQENYSGGKVLYNEKVYNYDAATFTRKKEGLNLKIGMESLFLKRFYFDMYMGVGSYRKNNWIDFDSNIYIRRNYCHEVGIQQ